MHADGPSDAGLVVELLLGGSALPGTPDCNGRSTLIRLAYLSEGAGEPISPEPGSQTYAGAGRARPPYR